MSFVSTAMKVTSAIVIFASSTSVALAGHYKGEMNYKGENVVAPCPTPCMLKDGFYVGAQVGYDSYRVRRSFSSPVAPEFSTSNPVYNATGWVGGLFLGYGQYMSDMFYLGGEVFGNGSDADVSHGYGEVGFSANSSFRARGSWGLALLPGVRLNDTTLGYVRLGWNWVSFRGTYSDSTGVSVSRTHTSNGFNYGVGMETLLVDNWSARTEFTHTSFNNFSSGYNKWSASDNQFMLGLIYHFC